MKQYGEKCLIVNGRDRGPGGHHGAVRDTYTHGHHALGAAQPHLAHRRELGRLPPRPPRPGPAPPRRGLRPRHHHASTWPSRVAPGPVVGIDASPEVLAGAAGRAGPTGPGRPSSPATPTRLPFDDASFDVVHAHQVLQHLTRPVDALAEMRRVLRPGGVLAVRDSDYAAFAWAPADPLARPLARPLPPRDPGQRCRARRRPPPAGLGPAAGFDDPVATSSTWTFADPESRALVGRAVGRAGAPLGLRRPGPWLRRPPRRAELEAMAGALLPLGGRARRLLRRPPRRGPGPPRSRSRWGRRPPVCDAGRDRGRPPRPGSAASYGVASVLQHQAAEHQGEELALSAGLAVRLVRSPRWLLGNVGDLVGFVLQLLALRHGPVTLVEPLLVTSLVFAFPVAALVRHQRVPWAEPAAAVVVTAGLALFLAVARPGPGTRPRPHGRAGGPRRRHRAW